MILEPFQVALSVADAFERCSVPYVVGGSLASSVSGEPRSTLDIDLVVALTEADVEPFLTALGQGFHADDHALRRAVRQRSSVNLFHRATSTKVDLFIAGGSPLQKLRWYRLGGEVSDRQWRDILGIVLVQGNRLDKEYLRDGARLLDVPDLLDRALRVRS